MQTDEDRSANSQTGFAPYGSAVLSWGYDSFGNEQGEALSGSTPLSLPQVSHTYTGYSLLNGVARSGVITNQMDGYNYDASGDLLYDNISSSYSYDAEGRVASVDGTISYLYDAEGRRVAKLSGGTLTNQYLLGLDGEQISELDGQGNWLRSNVYANGRLLATYNPAGLHFHFEDWLGTRRVQGSGTGIVEQSCQSLPFGDALTCTGTDATPLHFTGKERDAESGLDYFGARYYGSNMGRFMSPDPINLTEDRLLNPSNTLNKYAYGANNPLKYVDHDGKDITLFYDPSGVTHLALAAYNPQAGTGTFESFAPSSHTLGDQASELLGNDASGSVSDYKVSQFGNADFLHSNYASLTIQTSPEVTQEVVTYINTHSDGNWNLYSNNCSDACTRVLHDIQIAVKGGTPTSVFTNLLGSHGSRAGQQLFSMDRFNIRKGIEYGTPRPGIDPFQWLQLLAQHCTTETVTVTINGQSTSSSHQNCHM